CLLSFLSGHYLSSINSPIKKVFYAVLVISVFTVWLYFAAPWISYEAKTDVEFKNKSVEYQLNSINTSDSILSNTSLKGKVVLLDFWYKSCGVCIRQYPKMEAVFDHFKDNKDVAIYFVNNGLDSTETITEFIKNKNIRIPVLIDKNSLLVKKLKLDGFPAFLLIDKKGVITEMHIGYSRDEASVFEEQTIKKIEALLKE
ncbi:MAG: TlpA family protein disulfide reductase, partial [Bacteroidia bacterium]|nr:TlpA family protein disulfide reductase [Bacteroidia bacterium]